MADFQHPEMSKLGKLQFCFSITGTSRKSEKQLSVCHMLAYAHVGFAASIIIYMFQTSTKHYLFITSMIT